MALEDVLANSVKYDKGPQHLCRSIWQEETCPTSTRGQNEKRGMLRGGKGVTPGKSKSSQASPVLPQWRVRNFDGRG